MDIFKIIAVGICGAVFSLVIKEYKPSLAIGVTVISAFCLLFAIFGQINYIFDVVRIISSKLSVDNEYIEIILKITGVSYLARFGTEICRDAGQNAIAANIEIAGKIIIVVMSIPILIAVMNLMVGLL